MRFINRNQGLFLSLSLFSTLYTLVLFLTKVEILVSQNNFSRIRDEFARQLKNPPEYIQSAFAD